MFKFFEFYLKIAGERKDFDQLFKRMRDYSMSFPSQLREKPRERRRKREKETQ